MNFSFGDDQRLLRDGVRDMLASECTVEDVAQAWTDGPDRTRWKALASLGLVGLLAPEDLGGLGMDEVDLVLPLEEVGYAGLPEPLGEVAAVTVPLLVALGTNEAHDVLGRVCQGEAIVVPALSVDPFPAHVRSADLVAAEVEGEIALVQPTGLALTDQPNVDHARPTVSIDGVPGGQVVAAIPEDQLHLAWARGAWMASAQLVGTGRRMLDLARDHALEREQFGVPIGSFQAVKHLLAQALVSVEFARPLVHRAAWSLANGAPDVHDQVSRAKAVASEAAAEAAKAALQVHGAIGYTWEHPLHLFMKRAWSLGSAWSSTEHHWQCIEDHLLPPI